MLRSGLHLVFGLFGFINIVSAQTGNPQETPPIISTLRAQFEKASAPSETDLLFGQTWKCAEIDAEHLSGDRLQDYFKFTKYGVGLANVTIQNKGYGKWAFSPQGLADSDSHIRTCVRVTGDGSLIAERTFSKRNPSDPVTFMESAAFQGRYITGFVVCPVTAE